jgi:hypothetical protein
MPDDDYDLIGDLERLRELMGMAPLPCAKCGKVTTGRNSAGEPQCIDCFTTAILAATET